MELPRLRAPDIRDQRGMIVAAALIVAVLPVVADVAMSDRLRIGGRSRNFRDGGPQARANEPEVRGEVRRAVSLLLQRRDDMEAKRQRALHGGEHLAVGAELENCAGPGFASELRIRRLVGP